MTWIDIIDNNTFLRSLFPKEAPSLERVRLHEVKLHQDGPTITLRFDLGEYPENPIPKWNSENNTIQVCLMGIGIQSLSIASWTSNNIGRLNIEGSTSFVVSFDAPGCHLAIILDHLRIDSVTSYRQ